MPHLRIVLFLLPILLMASCASTLPGTTPAMLRVMTFNIRYDNPGDGENAWPHRKDMTAGMIRFHRADLAGLQEALKHQIDDLAERLPDYAWFGVGRDDGRDAGEFTPIFYRKDRFELLEHDTFWLSTTPEVPGSKSWDAMAASEHPNVGATSSWNGFLEIEPGRRIDYIFVGRSPRVLQHGILSETFDGRFPSDHLPVLAEVALP